MWPLNYYNTGVTVELDDIIKSGVDIWAFDYPSYYKGDDKKAFEQKVLDHYRFRQIGQETVGRWLHYFRTRVREIMPFYLQLYESQELMQSLEDPFGNVDITETFEETRTGESETESHVTNSTDRNEETFTTTGNTRKYSDTPQGSIANLDTHLSEATVDDGTQNDTGTVSEEATGSSSSSGSETGTVRHTLTRKGNQGVNTYAHDMKELRETFLNIDMMIINELNDLFLKVY